jgi:hypothetical protein
MKSWRCMITAALLLASSVKAEDGTRSWNFNVYLDDKPVGYHHFTLRQQGAHRELQSSARFDVKVLFVNAYQYVHEATEQWSGNCLQGLTSGTDDNGKQLSVVAQLQGAELTVTNSQHHYTLPGCVMSFAYWNPAMLSQTRLLNAQTGEYDRIAIADLGQASINVRGAPQASKHYRLTGSKLSIDLWYSSSGEWLALESTTENGRRLRYVLS